MKQGNWQLLLLSVVLSVSAWFFVSGRAQVDALVELPVQLTAVPKNMVIQSGLPTSINVRVRGPQGLLRALDPKTAPVSINLSTLKVGTNVVELRADLIPLSKGFEIVEVQPQRLTILADRFAVRTVPVVPQWDGALDPDWELRTALTAPEMTEVRGPEKVLEQLQRVETQVIAINATRPGLLEESVPLILPEEVNADPATVQVRLLFSEKRGALQFSAPVQVNNLSMLEARARPRRVILKVEAPVSLVRDESWTEEVAAVVTIQREARPGSATLPFVLQLPQGVRILEASPETVDVTLEGDPVPPQPRVDNASLPGTPDAP